MTLGSHTVGMLFAEFTDAVGLDDDVDALRANRASMGSTDAESLALKLEHYLGRG